MFMEIEIAYATPGKQALIQLDVPDGCTVSAALDQSAIRSIFPKIEIKPGLVGIFSQKVEMDHVLQPGDRIEIYRPLIADPKEMRKQRARRDAKLG